MMETDKKCEYYSTRKVYSGFLDYPFPKIIGECLGTKECEECKCGGDQKKCDFYEYIREHAKRPAVNVLTCSPSNGCAQETYINPAILMERLINRSIKEERELPWWVCQEIYNFNNKGE